MRNHCGPRGTQADMQRAEMIGAMTVLDELGTSVPLHTLWRDRPAVLVFVRHFG